MMVLMTTQHTNPATEAQARVIADLMFEENPERRIGTVLGWYQAVADTLALGNEEISYAVAEASLIKYKLLQMEANFGQVTAQVSEAIARRAAAARARQQAVAASLSPEAKARIAARRADRNGGWHR